MEMEVYRVHSMHGPTVYGSDHAGFKKLLRKTWQLSRNAGPYRVIYLPTGEVVAIFDRNDDGTDRPGMTTLEDIERM